MDDEWIDRALDGIFEQLAAIEHERWSDWQRFMHGKAERALDGSLVIPAELAARWTRQMNLAYAQLEEVERDSDREQVRRYLPLIAQALKRARR